MLKTRFSRLPGGWYPRSDGEWTQLFSEDLPASGPPDLVGGVVPHAGWFFSGRLLVSVVMRIPPETDLVVVAGGHLPVGAVPLYWDCDRVETPFGSPETDREFTEAVADRINGIPDTDTDNTVEVVMPALARLLPRARVAGFRLSPDLQAIKAGRIFSEVARKLGRRTVVIGSTDLTHYGPRYGFNPSVSGSDPSGWVAMRDHRFLDALCAGQGERALELARAESSACSAGGAVSALAFAQAEGSGPGRVLEYTTSLEKHRDDSFVGYGAVVFGP